MTKPFTTITLSGVPEEVEDISLNKEEEKYLMLKWKASDITVLIDESFLNWMKTYFIKGG